MISLLDIYSKTKDSVRPLVEGEQYFKSGLLMSAGIKLRNETQVKCLGLAAQTSGIMSYPYEVECLIELDKPEGERVLQLSCKCPAGKSSKCKHCIALLLHLNRFNEEDLEDLSCTDLEQQWGKLKTSHCRNYEAKKLSDLCHVSSPEKIDVNVTKELRAKWRKILINSAPLSEYSLFFSGLRKNYSSPCNDINTGSRQAQFQLIIHKLITFKSWLLFSKLVSMTKHFVQECESTDKEFYKQYVLTNLTSSVNIGAANQGGEGWLNERKLRITGSICYSLFTYASNKSPDWDRKFKSIYVNSFGGNSDTLHGLRCEPLAREKYSEWAKVSVVEPGLIVRPELPWLGFSPDGVIINDAGDPVKIIEIKSPKEGIRLTCNELIKIKAVKSLDDLGKLKKKHPHYGQIQLGMLLMGIERVDYLVYSAIEDNFILVPVEFDENFADELTSSLCAIYFKQILPRLVRA